MENPFLPTVRHRFVDREEIIALARLAARCMSESGQDVVRVLLFGSFARGDYSAKSDLDLLVVLGRQTDSAGRRLDTPLPQTPAYPTDVLVYTESELQSALASADPFITRILAEAVEIYPAGAQ